MSTLRGIVLCTGVVIAVTWMAIGSAILADAHSALLGGRPSHEVQGWVLSRFSLMSGAINLWQNHMLSLIHVAHRDVTHVGFTSIFGWICPKISSSPLWICCWHCTWFRSNRTFGRATASVSGLLHADWHCSPELQARFGSVICVRNCGSASAVSLLLRAGVFMASEPAVTV